MRKLKKYGNFKKQKKMLNNYILNMQSKSNRLLNKAMQKLAFYWVENMQMALELIKTKFKVEIGTKKQKIKIRNTLIMAYM